VGSELTKYILSVVRTGFMTPGVSPAHTIPQNLREAASILDRVSVAIYRLK
jgi:hypothetical protein